MESRPWLWEHGFRAHVSWFLTASPEPTVWPTEGTKRLTMDGWSGGFSVASTPANNSNNVKDLGGGIINGIL